LYSAGKSGKPRKEDTQESSVLLLLSWDSALFVTIATRSFNEGESREPASAQS
jgi:hypothetical protein